MDNALDSEQMLEVLSSEHDSEISKDSVDSQHSQLNNVINFYQKIPDVEKDYGCGIFQLGDNIYNFPSTEDNKLTDSLSDEFRKETMEEMLDWEIYMYCKENEESKQCCDKTYLDLPIRNQGCSSIFIQFLSKNHRNKIRNSSYKIIDESQYGSKEDWDLEIDLTRNAKREKLALEQKSIGNKYYGEKNFQEAIEYYTKSLNLLPTVDSFNNRAMCYMKLKNFPAAVRDTNEVLKLEPSNLKALYRRTIAKKEMKMYQEALQDVRSGTVLNSKTFLNVRNDIENEMSRLNGKKYNICPETGSRRAFEIDVSQLMIYAKCDESYLLEVDKTGCTRSCICGYCTEENRRNRNRSSALRIKERERWKLLTLQLLNEMKILATSANETNQMKTVVVADSANRILIDDSYNVNR